MKSANLDLFPAEARIFNAPPELETKRKTKPPPRPVLMVRKCRYCGCIPWLVMYANIPNNNGIQCRCGLKIYQFKPLEELLEVWNGAMA